MRDEEKTGRGRAKGPAAMEGADAAAGDVVRKVTEGKRLYKEGPRLFKCYLRNLQAISS